MDHLRQLHTVVSIGTLLLNVVESEESTVRKQTSWQLSIGLATDLDGDTGMEKNPKTPLLTKPCVRMNKAADVCVNLKTGDRKRLSLGFPLATLLSSMVSLQSAIHDLLSYLSIMNIYTELLTATISFLWGSDSKDRKVITSVPLTKMKRWKKSPNNPTTLIA